MNYRDFLKQITDCPFCNLPADEIIEKNDNAFLTFSLAPYHKHHILVIPYRHIEKFQELNDSENNDINKLLHRGAQMLEALGYTDYSVLVRNGDASGRTIKHLHYHLIPFVVIGGLNHAGGDREIMTKEEIQETLNDFAQIKRKI